MRVAILSKYSGLYSRGVETWANNLKLRSDNDIVIVSGSFLLNAKKWLNADIIIPTNGRFQTLIIRLVTWILHRPMIVFGHSGPGADDKWNLLCMPDVFVSFSFAQKKWVDRFKSRYTKSIVINHAVDTKMFNSGKSFDKKTVLCVAANTPDKRVDLVRSAVELLTDVKLRVVGNGQDEEFSYKYMPKIYKSASVFCFVPEYWEAFGLVYLEAMASNLPVVTINDPVRREIVGDAGLFVDDPTDIKSLSLAIHKAIVTDWKTKPRLQAEKFSWDLTVDKYSRLFKDVLKST